MFCWGFPAFLTLIPLTNVTFGAPPGWCFYIVKSHSPVWSLTFWYWFSFYFWIWATVIFNFAIYIRISYHKTTLFVETRKVINDIMFTLVWYPILIVYCWSISAIVDTIVTIDSTSFDLFPNYNFFVEITAVGIPCSQGILLALIYWTTMKSARSQLKGLSDSIFGRHLNKIVVIEVPVRPKQQNIIGLNTLSNTKVTNNIQLNQYYNSSLKTKSYNKKKLNQRVSFSEHSIERVFDIESNVLDGLVIIKKSAAGKSISIPILPTVVNTFTTNRIYPSSKESTVFLNNLQNLTKKNLQKHKNIYKKKSIITLIWNYIYIYCILNINNQNELNSSLETLSISNNEIAIENEKNIVDFF